MKEIDKEAQDKLIKQALLAVASNNHLELKQAVRKLSEMRNEPEGTILYRLSTYVFDDGKGFSR